MFIRTRDSVEKKAANHPRLYDATEDAYLKTSTMNVPCITSSLPITPIGYVGHTHELRNEM